MAFEVNEGLRMKKIGQLFRNIDGNFVTKWLIYVQILVIPKNMKLSNCSKFTLLM